MSNRQWTDEEIEEAYEYWAWASDDSLRGTGEYLGIPERTIRNWHKQYEWGKRKKLAQAELAEPAVGEARVELKLGLSDMVKQLIADATNPKANHRDRLESQRFLAQLTFGGEYDLKQGQTFISLTEAKHIHLAGAGVSTPSVQELRRQASQAIEANVSNVERRGPKSHGPVKIG